jgi:hypothetical protein
MESGGVGPFSLEPMPMLLPGSIFPEALPRAVAKLDSIANAWNLYKICKLPCYLFYGHFQDK